MKENKSYKIWDFFNRSKVTFYKRLIFVLIFTFPVIILAVFNFIYSYAYLTNEIYANKKAVTSLSSHIIHERLDGIVNFGISLVTRPRFMEAIKNDDWTEGMKNLEGIMENFSFIDRIVLFDHNAIIKADNPSAPGVIGTSRADKNWYKTIGMEWKPFITEVYQRGASPKINVIALILPITSTKLYFSKDSVKIHPKNEILGILQLQFKLEIFKQWIEDSDVGEGGIIYIVDQNGHLVYHPRLDVKNQIIDFSKIGVVQKILQRKNGIEVNFNSVEREERLAAYESISEYMMGIVVTQPTAQAFAKRNNNILILLSTYFIILIVAVLIAIFLLNSQTQLFKSKEKAELASKAKSMFLANMSHEIRTPMNAVLGFAQLLDRDSTLSSDSHKKVTTILKSGEHLLSIINDILEMSRIEAGRTNLQESAIDLKALINDLSLMFSLQAEEKGLIFTVDTDPDVPRYIISDLGKLRQILINILGNAIKFTQKGNIEIIARKDGMEKIKIIIKDTGIGILPEEKEKLFNPFERTLRGEKIAGGTGLGLAISRKYARMLKGDIIIESNNNEGSCFIFTFNAPESELVPASSIFNQRIKKLAHDQPPIRVLIVDDKQINRSLMSELLNPIGFIVEEVSSGEEAIEKVNKSFPDIILMDYVMQGINGEETTKILRNKFPDNPLIIIGISASVLEEDKKKFLNSGINAFIGKPFREQDLFDLFIKTAGIKFETENTNQRKMINQYDDNIPNIDEMPISWNDEFLLALQQGNISKIRYLGEKAKEYDLYLSEYIMERINYYDIKALKKLLNSNKEVRNGK